MLMEAAPEAAATPSQTTPRPAPPPSPWRWGAFPKRSPSRPSPEKKKRASSQASPCTALSLSAEAYCAETTGASHSIDPDVDSPKNPVRRAALRLVRTHEFDRTVDVCIVINCVCLALRDTSSLDAAACAYHPAVTV